jgi:hypothetical protein
VGGTGNEEALGRDRPDGLDRNSVCGEMNAPETRGESHVEAVVHEDSTSRPRKTLGGRESEGFEPAGGTPLPTKLQVVDTSGESPVDLIEDARLAGIAGDHVREKASPGGSGHGKGSPHPVRCSLIVLAQVCGSVLSHPAGARRG